MNTQIEPSDRALACSCTDASATNVLHLPDMPCLPLGDHPQFAHEQAKLAPTSRFYTRADGSGHVEIVGRAVGDGSRTGRDDMVIYRDLRSGTLQYSSGPDFDRRMNPVDTTGTTMTQDMGPAMGAPSSDVIRPKVQQPIGLAILRGMLCRLGLHRYKLRRSYPYTSCCIDCDSPRDERSGYTHRNDTPPAGATNSPIQ